MKTRRLNLFLIEVGEPLLFWFSSFVILAGLMLFRLGSIVPGFSRPEVISHAGSTSFNAIVDDPFNAPYKVLVYGLDKVGYINGFSLRFISVLFALTAIWLFYYIVSHWHDRRTAILSTLLFACSAWFLHYARFATPAIALTLLLAALAYGHWIRQTKHSALVGIIGIGIAAWLLYIPGLVWFVVLGGLWQSRQVGRHLKETKLSIPLVIALGAAILAPLVYAISRQPMLLKKLVGLPAGDLPNLYDLFRHILNVPVQVFLRGPYDPVTWLGRLPLLDIFAASMLILGTYYYYQNRQLDRSKIIFAVLAVGTVLVGLRGSVSIIILAPFIYLLSAAGIAYLLKQWMTVYPRNPLARTIGVTLIVIAVLAACGYNLRHYFVAWPGAPATKRAYRLQI